MMQPELCDDLFRIRSKNILLVEDEALVAMFVEDELQERGVRVIGPAATVADALQLLQGAEADGGLDAAILDLNLAGESGMLVADALMRAEIPFMIMTGYDHSLRLGLHAGAPCLRKPFAAQELLQALAALMDKVQAS